jgi:hypothetical protein
MGGMFEIQHALTEPLINQCEAFRADLEKMSALGQEQTLRMAPAMSTFGR